MKKPDPSRFGGKPRRKPKADDLEMKGFSDPLSDMEPTSTVEKKDEIEKISRTEVRTVERPNERTSVRKESRLKIRHAFDIFEDQLRELHTFQLEALRSGKKKPKLGEMVQKALDMYLEDKSKVGEE